MFGAAQEAQSWYLDYFCRKHFDKSAVTEPKQWRAVKQGGKKEGESDGTSVLSLEELLILTDKHTCELSVDCEPF